MKTLTRILLIKSALLFALLLSGCEQAQVDAQMAELCAKDGGMKIYETVVLPKEEFKGDEAGYSKGEPKFFRTWNQTGDGYLFIAKDEYLKRSSPTIEKSTYSVIRQHDNKLLGIYVTYLRRGGDIFPRLGPDSAKRCPEKQYHLIREVFKDSELKGPGSN